MAEIVSSEEAKLMNDITGKLISIRNYKEYAGDKQREIDRYQQNLNEAINSRNSYQETAKKYELELIQLREQLRILLSPPLPVAVLKTIPETEKTLEDCVDQLEIRSKSEAQYAPGV